MRRPQSSASANAQQFCMVTCTCIWLRPGIHPAKIKRLRSRSYRPTWSPTCDVHVAVQRPVRGRGQRRTPTPHRMVGRVREMTPGQRSTFDILPWMEQRSVVMTRVATVAEVLLPGTARRPGPARGSSEHLTERSGIGHRALSASTRNRSRNSTSVIAGASSASVITSRRAD